MADDFDETSARRLMRCELLRVKPSSLKPRGATAHVVSVERFDESPDKWAIGVRWDSGAPASPIDWFAKRQFERTFEVVGVP